MGLILELPLPTVRMNGVQRKDLRLDHGRKTPETLEELVAEAEYYHGKDLNGDDIPDKVLFIIIWNKSMPSILRCVHGNTLK